MANYHAFLFVIANVMEQSQRLNVVNLVLLLRTLLKGVNSDLPIIKILNLKLLIYTKTYKFKKLEHAICQHH
jgi:hypothetical protein